MFRQHISIINLLGSMLALHAQPVHNDQNNWLLQVKYVLHDHSLTLNLMNGN